MGLFGRVATTAAFLLALAPSVAQALTFDFLFGPPGSGGGGTTFSGSGTFQASDNTPGDLSDFSYRIDSIIGTISNSLGGPFPAPIDATNPYPDNGEWGHFLYAGNTMTTFRVLFTTGDGAVLFDINSFTSADGVLQASILGSGSVVFNISPQATSEVPLPAALPLFATILAGGGVVAWRRKRKAAKVPA